MRHPRLLICFFLSTVLLQVNGQTGSHALIDSAKKLLQAGSRSDEEYIRTGFFIADQAMNIDQYDTAQAWLNYVAERLPVKKPSLFNYFLSSRQAEVYYYNGLQRLGLQEAERSLQIAQSLKDSLLLADSYNFLGLFHMNLDSNQKSIGLYREGMRYMRQPPYPPQYFSLTKPHHLYGNMAEAFFKLGLYDSAGILARKSLQLATAIQWGRGMAVANNLLGTTFFQQGQTDSAIHFQTQGLQVARKSGDFDVELLCYGGLGRAYTKKGNKTEAFAYLQQGHELLNKNPNVNSLFYLQFLENAEKVYRQYDDKALLIASLQKKAELENARMRKNDLQMNTLLNAGLKNETRLLGLEVEEARQKQRLANTRLMLLLLLTGLMLLGFFVYRYYQRQKLNLARVRSKISQDLHDDIGASLSSLQIYGAIAEKNINDDPLKAKEMIGKINDQGKKVMENLNDIVWSMKVSDDTATSLAVKIKNYGSELLAEKNINCSYTISPGTDHLLQNIHARKNILLLIKEAMNNISKYSEAAQASVTLVPQEKKLVLTVSDNGKGFRQGQEKQGNGLKNMELRAGELGGSFSLQTSPGKGTVITAMFPLQALSRKD